MNPWPFTFDSFHRPLFGAIAAALPERFARAEMDDGLIRQTFQSLLSAKVAESAAREELATASASASAPAVTTVPSFPPPMLDAMKRSWVANVQKGAACASSVSSPTRVMSELISGLRVRHDTARATRDGLVLIDIALRPSDDRYVALQVLRDFDYTRNTGQMMGSLQFERQVRFAFSVSSEWVTFRAPLLFFLP